MCTRLLMLALLGWSCNGDKDDTVGSDGDADTDTDSDTDSDADFFFDANGTLDGHPFELECPPDFLTSLRKDGSGTSIVSASCMSLDVAGFTVILFAVDPQIETRTECSGSQTIQVTSADGSKGFYQCAAGGVSEFELDITEVEETASSTVWAGAFSMAGDDGSNAANVSGAFRVESISGE